MNQTRALITGCASGIGRDLAQTLLDAGHRVLATDLDEDRLSEAARDWPPSRARTRRLDVTDPAQWQSAVEAAEDELGGLDVLMNVAGALIPGWHHELTDAAVDLHVDVNLKGVIHGTRAVTPGMMSRGRGHVINVASLAALAPVPGLAIYCATKYAVRGYSLSVAAELRRHGVAVTVVCPDAVQTPMLDIQRDVEASSMTFSGPRVLQPREVSEAIVDAMRQRPLEVLLPRSRGWLAKLADLAPASGRLLEPVLRWQGRRKQRR